MIEILPSFVSSASVDSIASMLIGAAQNHSSGMTIMLNALGQVAIAPYAQLHSRPDGASVTFYRQDAAPTELEDGTQEYSPLDEVIDVRLQVMDQGTRVTFALQDENYRSELEYLRGLFSHAGSQQVVPSLDDRGSEPAQRPAKSKGKPGRPQLKCNEWARAQVNAGRTRGELLSEYEQRYTEETGAELADPRKSLRQATKGA